MSERRSSELELTAARGPLVRRGSESADSVSSFVGLGLGLGRCQTPVVWSQCMSIIGHGTTSGLGARSKPPRS